MRKIILASILLSSSPSWAGTYLTQEMETLRADLGSEDPARRELTLRLADLYFDLSIKDDPENKSQTTDRERSLALYQEALKGDDGFRALEGETRLKVLFQTARLQDKLGHKEKAEILFNELYRSPDVPRNLKLEATLYLGELNEDRAKLPDAMKFYMESISLCTSVDTCNFAHYRLGWTYFKATQLDQAIAEIKLALWDAKNQLRDQAVNDLISFMSQRQTDGKAELKEIEEIIKKSKNQALMNQMAETFYLAGNREAGGYILAHINKKNPSMYNEMRLLEESYGFRKWDDVDKYLTVLERKGIQQFPSKEEEKSEMLKIHRRLVVQLDAEAETKAELENYLKRSIDLYLKYYPNDEMKIKMQEGWLKIEKDNLAKIKRLENWIAENIKLKIDETQIDNLRRTRLSLAQKENQSQVVIWEARELEKTAKNMADAREYKYVAAFELNKTNRIPEAEILFNQLIDESIKNKLADKWMIQSQHLLLDNFNARKDFNTIMTSVERWSLANNFEITPELENEFGEMKKIALQASFEKAVVAGETQESLEYFYKNCQQKVLVPQSCENAKVLSVKLKDQMKLVALLEMSKDEAALVNEYELMGRFGDAAKLKEKMSLKIQATLPDYLKVSLLYELDLNFSERNRILNQMMSMLKNQKQIDAKFEKVVFVTLGEANMLDDKALSLNWSLPYKMKLVQMVHENHADQQTKKTLLAQKTYQGPVWAKIVLEEVQKMDKAQRAVSFYGANSKVMFKKKSQLLSQMEAMANSYLEGADSETRVYLLSLMHNANNDFAFEIINTPMPEELDEQMIEQVKISLNEMASGFVRASEDYKRLRTEEMTAVEDKTIIERMNTNLQVEEPQYAAFITVPAQEKVLTSQFNYDQRKEGMNKLMVSPTSEEALGALVGFYTNSKSDRIASYFKERIQLLKN